MTHSWWPKSFYRSETFMLSRALDRVSDRFVPHVLRQDPETCRQAKRVAMLDVAFLFWTVVYAAVFTALGSPRCGWMVLLAVPPLWASLLALKHGVSPAACGHMLTTAGWLALTSVALVSGGVLSPALLWYTCGAFVATFAVGPRAGIVWGTVFLATFAAFALVDAFGWHVPSDVPAGHARLLYVLVVAGLVLCHFVMAWVRVGSERRAGLALAEANRRLAASRSTLKTLQAGFGFSFSVEEWQQLKREKAALERVVQQALDDVATGDEDDANDDGLSYDVEGAELEVQLERLADLDS